MSFYVSFIRSSFIALYLLTSFGIFTTIPMSTVPNILMLDILYLAVKCFITIIGLTFLGEIMLLVMEPILKDPEYGSLVIG